VQVEGDTEMADAPKPAELEKVEPISEAAPAGETEVTPSPAKKDEDDTPAKVPPPPPPQQ